MRSSQPFFGLSCTKRYPARACATGVDSDLWYVRVIRALIAAVLLCSLPVFAQSGSWRGYVRGWVSDSSRVVVGFEARNGPRLHLGARFQLERPTLLEHHILLQQQVYFAQLNYLQQQQLVQAQDLAQQRV